MKALRDRLLYIHTDPSLLDVLCTSLTDWFDNQEVDLDEYPSRYHPAIITQTKIGWFHVFTGHLSQEWEILQNTYCSSKTEKQGLLWSTHVSSLKLRPGYYDNYMIYA